MSWQITATGPTSLGLLDQYGGAAAAYSLRNLSIYNTSPVVRVRRSGDNTESDFTAAQVSDGTLAAWVGAGNNGFVRTWYDQSGNGRNAIQTTTAQQPQIVSSGAVLVDGSNPVLAFNPSAAVSSNQNLTTSAFGLVHPFHVFNVFRFTAFIGTGSTPATVLDGATIGDSIDFRENGTNFQIYSGAYLYNGPIGRSTATGLYNALYNTSSSTFRYNASLLASGSAGSNNPGGLTIGNYAAGSRGAPARISELVVYSSSQAANQTAIEANINAHYSIY